MIIKSILVILFQLIVLSVKSEKIKINLEENLEPCELISVSKLSFTKTGEAILSDIVPCLVTRDTYNITSKSIIELELKTESLNNVVLIEAHDNDTHHIANKVLVFYSLEWEMHHILIDNPEGLLAVSILIISFSVICLMIMNVKYTLFN